MAKYVIRVARDAGVVALFVVAALVGTVTGVLFAYAGDLPQISALDRYAPNTITKVHAADGSVVAEFATERRVVIGFEDISPHLRQAIVAAEDAGFDRHVGVSIPRIVITLAQDVLKGRRAGGSTITQQLAKNLFLTPEKTLERKVKEALLAIQIEKRYTKREVFTLYCNQIYLGHGAYGVEAASHLYFDKRARDLTLEEAALIAGIIQLPERQSPFVDMTRATRRRNYVLQRMAEVGSITAGQAAASRQTPVALRGQPAGDRSIAPYFVEEVRKYVERKYGARVLYENGLSVQTTLEVDLQQVANRALDRGLRNLDKRHRGFRPSERNLISEGLDPAGFRDPRWSHPIAVDDVVPAVVVAVADRRALPASGEGREAQRLAALAARVRFGRYVADLTREGFAWTRRSAAAEILKRGDLVEVRVITLDEEAGTAAVALEQRPEVNGAVVVIENQTGRIRAMVGGLDFGRSKWNRATQADRQMGSAFKPVVYTAAIDRGFTPVSVLMDEPVSYSAGAGQPAYRPQNYDGKFEGALTLRRALEQSRNVPAVRVIEQLGPRQVIEYARRFGFQGQMDPYLSLALGSASASLLEVAAAFAVFPNQGVLMRPYQVVAVRDREGNLVEENRPEAQEAIRADTAFIMTSLLRGVVQRGTAAAAASLDWPLGGKTGTTNDFTDAWFVGFDPTVTIGVWVGYDDRRMLGPSETGAQAALPIWVEVMRAYIDRHGDRANPPGFQPPGNIVFLAIDRATGAPLATETPGAITEAFIAGTEPGTGR